MPSDSITRKPRTQDLTGKTFGILTVIAFAGYRKTQAWWTCQCSCPQQTIKDIAALHLLYDDTHSCGCLGSRTTLGERSTVHAMSETAEFRIWMHMIERCYKPHSRSFK